MLGLVRGTRFGLCGRGEVVFLSLEYASRVSGPLLGNVSFYCKIVAVF